METGLQTAVVDTSMTSKCPTWCTGEHRDVDVDIDGSTWHPGPRFGALTFTGTTRPDGGVTELGASCQDFGTGSGGQTPAELRRLAADALAAAEWLDSQSADPTAAETMVVEGVEMTLTRRPTPPDHDGRSFVAAHGLRASDDDEGPGVDIEIKAPSLDVATSTLLATISAARNALSS